MSKYGTIDYIVIFVCFAISWWSSYQLEKNANQNHPDRKPYTWGYFTGVAALTTGAAYSVISFYAASRTYRGEDILIAIGILSLIHSIAGYYVIKRKKVAWVVSTVLLLNPVGWIVNGIYAKNRWHEFEATKVSVDSAARDTEKATRNLFHGTENAYKNRLLLFISLIWMVAVFAFVFIFDIYGSYISSSEWGQLLKIAIAPPLLLIAGYFGYLKYVR